MSEWLHPKNNGLDEIEYDFGLKGSEAEKLSFLLNQAIHVYHYHAEGVWASEDKDSYSKELLKFIVKYPELESRFIRSKDRIIKMLTYRALELR
jgi:hypothetical protein